MKKTILKSLRQLFSKKRDTQKDLKRELLGGLGWIFYEWAEEFFTQDNLNIPIKLDLVFEDYLNNPETYKHCTIGWFKSKIKTYCLYKGYEYNPSEEVNVYSGKILRFERELQTTFEYIFIKSGNE